MKHILITITTAILFAACASSPEEKANALISERMKKSLYFPETYRPVETVLDSAFTPYDDPAFYEKALRLCKLSVAIEKYDREAKYAKGEIARHKDFLKLLYSGETKEELKQAQEEYNKSASAKAKAVEKAAKIAEELKEEIKKNPQYIGCKARHRYHANNNAGQTLAGEAMFLLDKDLKQILAGYDTETDEYKAVMLIYKKMRGEDIIGEDVEL